MLRSLKNLFDTLTAPAQSQSPAELAHQLKLASAVLLVQVMQADQEGRVDEKNALLKALKNSFVWGEGEIDSLLVLSEQTAATSHDYHRFTSLLNDHCSQEQKIQLVESLWVVAYADAHLDENEQHLISKVAGLLHVTHGQYIAAKLHAKAAFERTPRLAPAP